MGRFGGITRSGFGSDGTDTSAGLYQLAVQSGLQKQADKIMASQAGEDPKKIFSGGFITDIFDVLNSFQYGVVGVLKGKSFLEGVKTRQSFTDDDALGDNGIPGMIAGVALDIAFDPLTYIAPATIVRKVPFLTKAFQAGKEFIFGKKVTKVIQEGVEGISKIAPELQKRGIDKIPRTFEDIEGGTRLGKYLASKLSWSMGKDPVYLDTIQRGQRAVALEAQNIMQLAKGLKGVDDELASKIFTKSEVGEVILKSADEMKKALSPEDWTKVEGLITRIDEGGEELTKLGMLSEKTWQANRNQYVKQLYTEHLNTKSMFGSKALGVKAIQARKTPEEMTNLFFNSIGVDEAKKLYPKFVSDKGFFLIEKLKKESPDLFKDLAKQGRELMQKQKGIIEDPAYVLAKTALDISRNVENGKLLQALNKNFATDVAQEGFTQVAKTAKWGDLAGKYIPSHMADYINEIIEPSIKTLGKKAMGEFKFYKVIMNPSTHSRNVMSNMLLNWWKLGIGPWRLDKYASAIKDISTNSEMWQRAQKVGGGLDTFASAELNNLLDSPEALGLAKGVGSGYAKFKKFFGDIYQHEESVAKLTAFKEMLARGLSDEEAWKAAESATFNYAQVTPFVRKLRESMFGYPFITFSLKATPVALETAVKAPHRISVIGKIKQGIESLADIKETEAERASEPPYLKDNFYIKLPIKDKHGRSAYFDLTYILPFGDLIAGNFFERQISRTTGLPESIPLAIARKSPFISLVADIGKNQDFFGNKIWKETDSTDKQLGDLMRHLTKFYAPPAVGDLLPGGYNDKGERQNRGFLGVTEAEAGNQKRTVMQELLKNIGAKIQPFDADIAENYQELNKKRALQLLNIENGVLRNFNRAYIPK